MITILIPFFHKLDLFKIAFPLNEKFLREEHEVLIVVDEPISGKFLESYLSERNGNYTYRIISNPNEHTWRNPAKALNVGIRHAVGDYIIVMSPESICVTDVYHLLYQGCMLSGTFTFGQVSFLGQDELFVPDMLASQRKTYPYGSVCFKKEHLYLLRGYNEQLNGWGGEDDELRIRYTALFGQEGLNISEALIMHQSHERPVTGIRPWHHEANGTSWGTDFGP
jgi:hypothetical protein